MVPLHFPFTSFVKIPLCYIKLKPRYIPSDVKNVGIIEFLKKSYYICMANIGCAFSKNLNRVDIPLSTVLYIDFIEQKV